jgi:hypothetical protein
MGTAMLNERSITTNVLKQTAQHIRGAVIIKHADRATSAVPDFSVSAYGCTWWVEMKFLREGRRLKDVVKTNQLVLGNEIHTATNGRCWTVIFEEKPQRVTVWTPRALFAHLNPKLAGESTTIWSKPAEIDALPAHAPGKLQGLLNVYGAFSVFGWPYETVAKLCLDHV